MGDGRNQTPYTSVNTTFQREVHKLEPFQRKTVRSVKGLEVITQRSQDGGEVEVITHEKLGIMSLEKTEEMMGISSSISKLLHDRDIRIL